MIGARRSPFALGLLLAVVWIFADSRPARAQWDPCKVFQYGSPLAQAFLNQEIPGTYCREIMDVQCGTPKEAIDIQFMRRLYRDRFRSDYGGTCPADTFGPAGVASQTEVERTDNLEYAEHARRTFSTSLGDVEVIWVSFTSQVWKCLPWRHNLLVWVPANRAHPEFAILANQGVVDFEDGIPLGLDPFQPDYDVEKNPALRAARQGAIVVELFGDNPKHQFVREGALYNFDLMRVDGVTQIPLLSSGCHQVLDNPAYFHSLDSHMALQDSSYDMRFPTSHLLRRALTVLDWKFGVRKTILGGISKRGIATLMAAGTLDPRIAAIAPQSAEGVLDMVHLLNGVVRGNIALATNLLTPKIARDFLLATAIFPRFLDLNLVNFTYAAPILHIGAMNDSFFPPEINLDWTRVAAEKYYSIMPNAGHGADGPKKEATLEAFYSHIITGSPSFEYSIEVEPARAEGLDLLMEARVRAAEKVEEVTLWHTCDDDGDNSLLNHTYSSVPGDPASEAQSFRIRGGATCRYLASLVEIKIRSGLFEAYLTSLPNFPNGSPLLVPMEGSEEKGLGCETARGGQGSGLGFLALLLIVPLLMRVRVLPRMSGRGAGGFLGIALLAFSAPARAGVVDPSPDSVATNPAALAAGTGTTVLAAVQPTLVSLRAQLDDQPSASSRAVALPFFLGGTSGPWFDRVWGGLAFYLPPTGTYASFPERGPQRFHLIKAKVFTLNLTPAIAVRPVRFLSLGAGYNLIRGSGRFRVADDAVDDEAVLDLDTGTAWTQSWTIGAWVHPIERLTLGASYITGADFQLEGPAHVNYVLHPANTGRRTARLTTRLPAVTQVGAGWQLSPRLSTDLLLRLEDWSRVETLLIEWDTGTDVLEIDDKPRGHRNTLGVRCGLRYMSPSYWIFSPVLGYRRGSLKDDYFSAQNLDLDTVQAGLTVAHPLSPTLAAAVGFQHSQGLSRAIRKSAPDLDPSAAGEYGGFYDQLTLGLTYRKAAP
ncbi:MAG: outer membrane protein transport protein [Nitrospirae bacterium]|nr:outer membrane protein transport protein [Nitrospirota bacterium]